MDDCIEKALPLLVTNNMCGRQSVFFINQGAITDYTDFTQISMAWTSSCRLPTLASCPLLKA